MRTFVIVWCLVGVLSVHSLCAQVDVPKADDVLQTLQAEHPRLMLKDDRLAALKDRCREDKVLQKCVHDVISRADGYLKRPAVVYKKVGPRLLSVSRDCLGRVYALGLAYRWTGRDIYADKAIENMLAACAFKDWNPSHYLDTAEMSHAVGVGYDWLYAYMDEATRAKVRAGLIKNGLEPGLRSYGEKKHWFVGSEHNWNQVCNGGMIIGALAIAETHPQYARVIVPGAVRSLPNAVKNYGPDGAWGEGAGYWSYATHYTAYGLAALKTAIGKDFGLSGIAGLSDAGYAPIYLTGPTGLYLNYADVGETSSRRPMACMFWLAEAFNNPAYAYAEHEEIAKRKASPQHVVWYVPPSEGKPPARDLDRYFRGDVELALFRSAWDDPDALFVGVKAGYNQVNHGHLDLGNFELDALGQRWARDLGSDNYNLPGYWSSGKGGKRWSYYRLNSNSHNICMLGGENQNVYAKSAFSKVKTGVDEPFVLVDLGDTYKEFAQRAVRGVAMIEGRRAVVIQDEFKIDKPCDVAWGMTTDAKITIGGGGKATLQIGDKRLIATVLSPAGAKFTVGSAEQKEPQKKNTGVKRLLVKLPKAQGDVRITVQFSPVWEDTGTVDNVPVKPLSKW